MTSEDGRLIEQVLRVKERRLHLRQLVNREATSVRGYVALREQRCRQHNYPKSTLTAIWTFSRMQLLISERRSTTVRSRKRGGLALCAQWCHLSFQVRMWRG
jgi:hypothetical protein